MSPVECANLGSMLDAGPSFARLKTRAKANAALHGVREVLGQVAPFQRCDVFDSIAGTSLSCALAVPIENIPVVDKEGHAYLRAELAGMARDIASCLGQPLPQADPHKRMSQDAASDERFGWSFVLPARRAGADAVVGTTISARIPAAGTRPPAPMAIALDAEFSYVERSKSTEWLQDNRRAWARTSVPTDRPAAAPATPDLPPSWWTALSSVAGMRRGDTIERAVERFGSPDKTDAIADSELSVAYWFGGGFSITFIRETRRIAMLKIEDAAAAAALRQSGVELGIPFTLIGSPADAVERVLGPPSRARNSFYRWRLMGSDVHEFRVFCFQGRDCKDFHVHWR